MEKIDQPITSLREPEFIPPSVDLDAAVNRFLAWPLPEDFAPDCGIHYLRIPLSQPTGTNLLHAGQARAMLEHVLFATASNVDSSIPPHQQRVLDEKRELDEKLVKLRTFIDGSPVFSGLPVTDQSHLKSQLAVMEVYSCILADRIARFGGAA